VSDLDLFEHAIAAAQDGIQRAVAHAEADHHGWTERALDFLREYARKNERFPGFFVTAASEKDRAFPQPKNEKAWGAIYRRAAREGVIIDSGKTMKHPKRHGCPATIWRSRIFKG
jgi:hypothetical protein